MFAGLENDKRMECPDGLKRYVAMERRQSCTSSTPHTRTGSLHNIKVTLEFSPIKGRICRIFDSTPRMGIDSTLSATKTQRRGNEQAQGETLERA
jgi:hypothetical protein